MRKLRTTLPIHFAIALGAMPLVGRAQDATVDQPPPVSKIVGVYTHPPTTVGSLDPAIKAYRIPDGPLMGNGDLAVAVGGTATEQTFYLSKSDLSQSARGIGGVTYSFEGTAGTTGYRQEEDLCRAEVRSAIPLEHTALNMRSWTAHDGNVLVSEITSDRAAADIDLKLWSYVSGAHTQAGTAQDVIWATREISTTMGTTKQPFRSKVAMAVRIIGASATCTTDGKNSSTARFSVPSGKSVLVITALAGGYQVDDHIARATELAASLDRQKIDDLQAAHLRWWTRYWSKSSISIGDELVEKFYYGAQYVLGCSSREGSVAPGLAGPWHLNGPICWSNKYTLDYNFEAPWWGVYSSNRAELAEPFYDVILKLIPEGKRLAQEHGTKGILFGVNAHAWGGFTDTRTLNMKSNASLAALNFMMHYHYTKDNSFLVQKAWPLLKELDEFWQDNLIRNEATGRWCVRDSGAREGQKDDNAITDLAYVNAIYRFLLETADTLEGKQSAEGIIHISDAQKVRWRGYVERLSPYPTMILNGQRVFKEAENRQKMSLGGAGDNSDVLDGVFPGQAIGLGSDPLLLQTAQNTVAALNPDTAKASWFQANSFPKIYTQAIRAGYPAEKVIEHLKQLLAGRQPYDDRGDHAHLRDNLTINPPAHSFEYVGAIEAVNSMLLQSQDQTIRVFPNWINGKNASFHHLRACGSFLVSSELKNGTVTYINIVSEMGGTCRLVPPWNGHSCRILRIDTGKPQTIPHDDLGNAIVFRCEKGGMYRIEGGAGEPSPTP
jgi:alpha-L-fucosidase 2